MATVELTWLDPVAPDQRDLAGAVAVLESARLVDCPHEIMQTPAGYLARLRHGWDGDPPSAAVVHDDDGHVVGVLEVDLPRWDNRHLGFLQTTVDPLVRRQGLGRSMFQAGVDVVRAAGRTTVMTESFDTPGTLAFAAKLGLAPATTSVKRTQDLRAVDLAALDQRLAGAADATAAYELVRLPRHVPDELMPAYLDMVAAINDAPTDDLDVEDEVFSADRARSFQTAQAAAGRRVYQLAARHRETGVLAGHTLTAVESEQPRCGHQFDTSVLRTHRGHRLGLLLKVAMLHWFAECEPQLRELTTWNAASNPHMIAVNEVLGYQVVATATVFQQHL